MVKPDPFMRLTMDDLVKLTFGSNLELVAYIEGRGREDGIMPLAVVY
jgi:hypothetical protein